MISVGNRKINGFDYEFFLFGTCAEGHCNGFPGDGSLTTHAMNTHSRRSNGGK